jgi:predicted N-formylglutamate amidohydrolase
MTSEDGVHMRSSWVIHLPHASTMIPATVRPELLLSDQDLALEVLRMTDHLTDELVAAALPAAQRVCFPFSRLVLDPERFPIDADEPMSRVGTGVIYDPTGLCSASRRRQRFDNDVWRPTMSRTTRRWRRPSRQRSSGTDVVRSSTCTVFHHDRCRTSWIRLATAPTFASEPMSSTRRRGSRTSS